MTDARLRIAVLADEAPVPGALGMRLLSLLAARASDLDVAVAAGEVAGAERHRLEGKGIEVVPGADAAWVAGRAFRETVVIVEGPRVVERFGEALDEHQPQAAVVYDLSAPGSDDHVRDRAYEVAGLRRAAVVLAPSRAHARFARELSPAEVIVASPGTPDLDRALAHALAAMGIAVPDAAFAQA
jgi:hypothetical protein